MVMSAVHRSGHRAQCRPPYAPERAPIENCFHVVKQYLRRHSREVNAHNLAMYVYRACETITPAMIRRFFGHCGYL